MPLDPPSGGGQNLPVFGGRIIVGNFVGSGIVVDDICGSGVGANGSDEEGAGSAGGGVEVTAGGVEDDGVIGLPGISFAVTGAVADSDRMVALTCSSGESTDSDGA